MQEIVDRNKLGDPVTYRKWLSGADVTSIVFAALEDGKPVVVSVSFHIDAKGQIVKRPSRNTLYATPGAVNTGRFGYTKEMATAIASPTWGKILIADPIRASEELIQREIAASSKAKRYDVGPPISIVRISKQSAGWEPGHEGACADN